MSGLMGYGTVESVSWDQILRRERGKVKNSFPVQVTSSRIETYPVDPYSAKYIYGQHFQQSMDQPGIASNPDCGKLNRNNYIFPVPVRA